jgi:hypothetical protein
LRALLFLSSPLALGDDFNDADDHGDDQSEQQHFSFSVKPAPTEGPTGAGRHQ